MSPPAPKNREYPDPGRLRLRLVLSTRRSRRTENWPGLSPFLSSGLVGKMAPGRIPPTLTPSDCRCPARPGQSLQPLGGAASGAKLTDQDEIKVSVAGRRNGEIHSHEPGIRGLLDAITFDDPFICFACAGSEGNFSIV